MIVDGKEIAKNIYEEIKRELSANSQVPHLTVFTCAPTGETQQYLRLKMRKAREVGISVSVIEFDQSVTTAEVVVSIVKTAETTEGIVVQLPFPSHIDTDEILRAIPGGLDVDVANLESGSYKVLPPVVGAIKEIAARHEVDFKDKKVAVVGQGRLVGKPAALWATAQSSMVTVVDKKTPDADLILKEADIIISGAGVPGLITPEKIKEGAIIFDAGTSEDGGVLRGDADPLCAPKCALFTPVPGGIGPITVAVLLRNLILLARK